MIAGAHLMRITRLRQLIARVRRSRIVSSSFCLQGATGSCPTLPGLTSLNWGRTIFRSVSIAQIMYCLKRGNNVSVYKSDRLRSCQALTCLKRGTHSTMSCKAAVDCC